jgi:hypothetical protein
VPPNETPQKGLTRAIKVIKAHVCLQKIFYLKVDIFVSEKIGFEEFYPSLHPLK